MEINKIKITKERFWTECECGNSIYGTSEKAVKHNYKVHKAFCKGKKK